MHTRRVPADAASVRSYQQKRSALPLLCSKSFPLYLHDNKDRFVVNITRDALSLRSLVRGTHYDTFAIGWSP